MSSPTPLQSFLGGLGIPLPVHALLVLNGNVFGISGFLHGAVRGSKEAVAAVAGLILGGFAVGLLEGGATKSSGMALPKVLISGLLVGLGSKVRFSPWGSIHFTLTRLITSSRMGAHQGMKQLQPIIPTTNALRTDTWLPAFHASHRGMGNDLNLRSISKWTSVVL